MYARPTAIVFLAGLLVAGAVVGGGCGSGDRPLEEVDPEAAPLTPTYDQVFAIVERACAPCHTDDDGEDDGFEDDGRPRTVAGVGPPLERCQDIVASARDILDTTVGSNTMPPGAWPRLTEREKLIVKRWVEQGACTDAPCTACE